MFVFFRCGVVDLTYCGVVRVKYNTFTVFRPILSCIFIQRGCIIIQPSICPLTAKPLNARFCKDHCRYYGGVYNYVELICHAYGGTLEITPYNISKGRRNTLYESEDEDSERYY